MVPQVVQGTPGWLEIFGAGYSSAWYFIDLCVCVYAISEQMYALHSSSKKWSLSTSDD